MSQETAIVVTEIRAGYGRRTILHGFSFSLTKGEIVSLIGPNVLEIHEIIQESGVLLIPVRGVDWP